MCYKVESIFHKMSSRGSDQGGDSRSASPDPNQESRIQALRDLEQAFRHQVGTEEQRCQQLRYEVAAQNTEDDEERRRLYEEADRVRAARIAKINEWKAQRDNDRRDPPPPPTA